MITRPQLSLASEKGSIAVEMAFILPILVFLLTVMLFFARIFWVYSAGQKAAHDAARYISTATQAEMRTPGGGFNEARVPAVARWIAQEELLDIVPMTEGIAITILCDKIACSSTVPKTVRVSVEISFQDYIFTDLIAEYLGKSNLTLTSNVELPYLGK